MLVDRRNELTVDDVVPVGDAFDHLTLRLARLSSCLRTAVAGCDERAGDDLWLPAAALQPVEDAWLAVTSHRLSDRDARTHAFRAAMRLARWLAVPAGSLAPDLAGLTARHRDLDAWVDAATSDAASGVGDSELAGGLIAVLASVRTRRSAHDRPYALALADDVRADRGAVPGPEDLLPSVVLPLATRTPAGRDRASASRMLRNRPRSGPRQRRRPSPWS